MNIEHLKQQHKQIAELTGELGRAVASATPQPVSTLRWRLARELIAHLGMEDGLFYPIMMGSTDPQLVRTARDFQAEMGGLASEFKAYMAGWSDGRIASEWPAFCAQTKALIAKMNRRVDREERILYPMAAEYARVETGAARKSA